MSEVPERDQLLQATCEAIVTSAAQCADAEPEGTVMALRLPGGQIVGKQVVIDATEKGGPLNKCRMAVLNPELAPEGEVARIEYEHDKQTKHGMQRVYSIQSVRKRGGELVLLENFLAENAAAVREADFRRIESESYAQQTVLQTMREWAHFRAWQLQQGGKR
jgi:hypothetical protein